MHLTKELKRLLNNCDLVVEKYRSGKLSYSEAKQELYNLEDDELVDKETDEFDSEIIDIVDSARYELREINNAKD